MIFRLLTNYIKNIVFIITMNIVNIKIINIFLIFFSGFFGAILILFLKINKDKFSLNDDLFLHMKLFSAGIILGTGCIHMLPEAKNMFDKSGLTIYPYSELIFGLSIISIMALEEIVNKYFHKSKEYQESINGNHANYNSIDTESQYQHPTGEHCHTVNIVYQQDRELKKLITLYILEFGMAIHSIIIGITLGTSTDYNVLVALSIAIIFHQFFEGIALGSAIFQCENNLNEIKIFLIVLCYSLTTPIGICIGIAITNANSLIIQGVFNAISAGILVYMATIHFIIEDYINNDATGFKKFLMFLSLGFGYCVMAILGIWS